MKILLRFTDKLRALPPLNLRAGDKRGLRGAVAIVACCLLTLESSMGSVPAPGGLYPEMVHWSNGSETLYFNFSFDRGIPYNPVEAPSPRRHWDFAIRVRTDRNTYFAEITNRCEATIPIKITRWDRHGNEVPAKVVVIKAGATVMVPLKGKDLDFTFSIYDQAAIVPKGPH